MDLTGSRFNNRTLLRNNLVTAFAGASQPPAWRIGLFNTTLMLDVADEASIQQGRDNHLARYNDYRALLQYPKITRFEQINGGPLVVSEVRRVYTDVDQIGFFIGLFAEELPAREGVRPLIGRMAAADAFSHALTNPLLSPHVCSLETFKAAGMDAIGKTSTLGDLLARIYVVPAGARISMEFEGYRPVI